MLAPITTLRLRYVAHMDTNTRVCERCGKEAIRTTVETYSAFSNDPTRVDRPWVCPDDHRTY